MPSQEIQGIVCHWRELRDDEEVLFKDLPVDEQYFRIPQHPFNDEKLLAIANREYQYTKPEQEWVDRENKRVDEGVYAMIEGRLDFIPGAYYGWLTRWTLENGEKPDYREDDRLFAIFHEYLRLNTHVLGCTRGKGRRQGATSFGYYMQYHVAGREENKLCGSTSYNDDIVKLNFQQMFMFGFRSMLPCFQADYDTDSDLYIRFVKNADKRKKGTLAVKKEGLNSFIDTRPNNVNSYDAGRQSYNMPDEAGKRGIKNNINSYWSRFSKTLLIGAKKVGFAYLPTTVGSKKEGGENFRIFWNNCNQNKIDKKTGQPVGLNTPNRCVRYFMPASHCYAGYISKFGKSIVKDPPQPVLTNEGTYVSEGAETVILRERSMLEGEQLMEHRRDYPLTEYDMFAFETGQCEFNESMLIAQQRFLEEEPVFIRQVRLYSERKEVKDVVTQKVIESWNITKWMDDDSDSAGWHLLEEPERPNFYDHHGIHTPLNTSSYEIGVDTLKSGFAIHGSTGVILVFKKSKIIDGVETGLYPVAIWMGKPKQKNHLYEQVILACRFWGCKVNFEIDAGTDYYDYFVAKGMKMFLHWTPRIAIDVTARNKVIKPGTESANPYQLAMQLEVCKKYFDGTDPQNYNGNIHRIKFPIIISQAIDYTHSDRTKSDVIIALMMALLPCFGATDIQRDGEQQVMRPKAVIPTYKIAVEN